MSSSASVAVTPRAGLVRPAWLPDHVRGLDTLRGLAILLVLLFHCQRRVGPLHLGGIAAWGWSGVNLFFVLSGFLITGIVLDARPRAGFFGSFYARRALRILPVYILVVPVNYWIFGRANTWNRPGAVWPYFVFFAQNLVPGLTGTIEPTWSLAIEEQFYLLWAPIARRLPVAALFAVPLILLGAEPWIRRHAHGLPPTHTLIHLDGLACGALIALALRTWNWTPRQWSRLGYAALVVGAALWMVANRGRGSYLDTALAILFSGLVVLAATRASRAPGRRDGWWRPVRYLGTISYGLYLTHMLVFAYLGGWEARLLHALPPAAASLAVIAMRWSAAILVASLLWFYFERPILGLKRYWMPERGATRAKAAA